MNDETKENIEVEVRTQTKKEEDATGSPLEQAVMLDAEALQQIVLQSGVLEAILEAVMSADIGSPSGWNALSPIHQQSLYTTRTAVACSNLASQQLVHGW